jgi:hypothetical protein
VANKKKARAEAGRAERQSRLISMIEGNPDYFVSPKTGKPRVRRLAEAVGVHPATVSRDLQGQVVTGGTGRGRFNRLSEAGPDPIPYEELPTDLQELVDFTPDAFKAFFLKYSGEKYMPDHIWEIVKIVFGSASHNEWVQINIPPRHAKSTVFSQWLVIWLITRDRNVQIILTSQTLGQATKHSRKIEAVLSGHPQLIQDFGRFKPLDTNRPWRAGMGELSIEGREVLTESGDLTLQIRGAGQGILGMEADWIIGDDVADPENSASKTQRDDLFEWWHWEVLTRAEDHTNCVVLGTRFHPQDLYAKLARVKYDDEGMDLPVNAWKTITFPAVLDWETKEVLWPEKFKRISYFKRLRAHDPRMFEAMYQQNPLSEGEQMVRPEWIYGDEEGHIGCLDKHRGVGEATRQPDAEHGYIPAARVLSIDPSPTAYTGILVADVPFLAPSQEQQDFFAEIIEARREKMGPREVVKEIERVWGMYGPIDYLIFEKNAFARWFLQFPDLRKWMTRMRVIGHTTTAQNKNDQEWGVMTLAADFEFGRIRIPYANAESRERADAIIEEALNYPNGDMDDIMMALWFCKIQAQNLLPVVKPVSSRMREGPAMRVPQHLKGGFDWAKNWGKPKNQRGVRWA